MRLSRVIRMFSAVSVVIFTLLSASCTGHSGQATTNTGGRTTIRIALDWTPNTNHTGLFVAQLQGWYRQSGLDVHILPYSSTAPDTLVSSGAADFGISFQDVFTFSKAAGANITSVMAILQHWASQIAVRANDTEIRNPKDLDGKTYGGFGAAYEGPVMSAVIRNAGGKGKFKTVTLGTAAYQALYAKKVDFVQVFTAWEGIEASLLGHPLKTFSFSDYGFPDAYNVLLIGNSGWLQRNREAATAFVRATQRGYQYAADEPDHAATLLEKANPGVFSSIELVRRSQELLARSYLRNAQGVVGPQQKAVWQGFSGFLYDSGVLTGPGGGKLTERPDFAQWYTNAYLSP